MCEVFPRGPQEFIRLTKLEALLGKLTTTVDYGFGGY